jgi:Tol biopolymer transport system component
MRIYAPDTAELGPNWFRRGVDVSRDGRWIALPVLDRSTNTADDAIRLIALAGSAGRVVPIGYISYSSRFLWHPDGRHLVVLGQRRNAQRAEVWLIPLNGEAMRSLTSDDVGLEFPAGPAISPDGSRVAYGLITGVSSTLWEVDLTTSLATTPSSSRR